MFSNATHPLRMTGILGVAAVGTSECKRQNASKSERFRVPFNSYRAMIKVILMLLLTAVSSSSYADWVNFGTSVMKDGNVTAYVNRSIFNGPG